ncbi:kinase-like domain-containing protein [Paraphoma chrysanthemicola]|nr:kinase-like domain-containing protein [Paraphoma chrysanthemicola]
MTAVSRSQRPSADTVWNVLTNPTYFGQACGNCCLPEHTDKTTFTEWSGLQTYVPSRPRFPFDHQPDDVSSSEVTLRPGDDTEVPKFSYDGAREPLSTFDWTGQGRNFHVDFGSEEEVPAHSVRILGMGAFAMVEAVKCNGKLLARKTILTRRSLVTRAEVEKEVAVLLRLEHRHILQVVGSYTTRRSFSLLLYPACDWNLGDLIVECGELKVTEKERQRARTMRIMLKRSTQCLAQALEYVHENNVRHADVKPTNILYRVVDNDSLAHVYLADFGISKFVDDMTDTKTEGPVRMTRRFAPKESIMWESRGRAVDIFSLGCVFYEILATLLCVDLDSDGYRMSVYSDDHVKFHSAVRELSDHNGVADGLRIPRGQIRRFANLILQMTQEQQEDRPLAAEVALRLGANECCYLERETVGDEEDFDEHLGIGGTVI